jgi:hypothetical protein
MDRPKLPQALMKCQPAGKMNAGKSLKIFPYCYTETGTGRQIQVLEKHEANFSIAKFEIQLCCSIAPGPPSQKYNSTDANCGPGSSVGTATGYGLDDPGIESWLGARFSAPVQTGSGAHPASCTMGTGSSPGVKNGQGMTLTPHPLLVPLVMKE